MSESHPSSAHQVEHNRKKQELKQSKEKLGGRFRSALRLNLDALSASNRNRQIDAAMQAADNAYSLARTEDDADKRKSTNYILLTNPLRAMAQSESFQHSAASVDQYVDEKRGVADPDFQEKPVYQIRREAKKIYFDTENIAVLYGADNLTSNRVSEEDKLFMLDQLSVVFSLLDSDKPADIMSDDGEKVVHVFPEGESVRDQIVQEIRSALPKLSPELQERALIALTKVDSSKYANRLLRETNEKTLLGLDEEAQEKFLESLTPDLDNVSSLLKVLDSNPSPGVHVAIAKFLNRFSQQDYFTDPGDRYYGTGDGVHQSKWQNLESGQQQKTIDYLIADITRILSKGVDRSINQLLADTIFNLSKKSRERSENTVKQQFYENSSPFDSFSLSSSKKPEAYDPNLMATLVGTLAEKAKDYREKSPAIELAESVFAAVLDHFQDELKAKKIDMDSLSADIQILRQMMRKFGKEGSGFMNKFRLGNEVTRMIQTEKYKSKLSRFNPRTFFVSRELKNLAKLNEELR